MIKIKYNNGFTLLEVIISIVILSIAFTICFQALESTLRSWKKSYIISDNIQHGDFTINQISSAFKCMIFFKNEQKRYAFDYEERIIDGYSGDWVSFVTANNFFYDSKKFNNKIPHRIELFLDEIDDIKGLYSITIPISVQADEYINNFNPVPKLISSNVNEFEILFWNEENENWLNEWDQENSIPKRILISVSIITSSDSDPIIYSRQIEIPASESLNDPLFSPSINQRQIFEETSL